MGKDSRPFGDVEYEMIEEPMLRCDFIVRCNCLASIQYVLCTSVEPTLLLFPGPRVWIHISMYVSVQFITF